MLRSLQRRPWTCLRCSLRQKRSHTLRNFQTASRVSQDYLSADKRHDDDTLRLVFDSKPFWRDFSQRKSNPFAKSPGLLQNRYLTNPDGYREFAVVCLRRCQAIVAKVLAANTLEEFRTMARDLDRLSDILCRVIDVTGFIRLNHVDNNIREAATQAHALMFEYMNVLNTTTGINEQLRRAFYNPEVSSHWTEEEKVTAQTLMEDFTKSAIHLPPHDRQKFVTLSNDISALGYDFANYSEAETPQLNFNKSQLRGMDPTMLKQLRRWTGVALPMYGSIPRTALSSVHDEEVRKQIYVAYRTCSKRQIHRLEELLYKRTQLAKLSGYPSYAHMALSDKMAGSPEAVSKFLSTLNSKNRPLVETELSKLLALKQSDISSATRLQPWDHTYYVSRYSHEHQQAKQSRGAGLYRSFFSLGTVMQGLSRLLTRLFGVRLVPRETHPGEIWNPDVRRLDVVDESDNHIAVVYCDLFSRPEKNPTPAHSTLRCSRAISSEEIAECAALSGSHHPNDGMATAVRPGTTTLYQLPTIALVCDFAEPPASGSQPTLLSQHSVQTLFHEMGHAMHSIFGRTDFQTISGTRCATDFAELPSVLMESFATSPEVLSLYAQHWETGAPLPDDIAQSMVSYRESRNLMHGAMDNESQILMALLDQAYHTSDSSVPGFDTTDIFHRVYQEHSSLPDPPDAKTAWQGYFGHLYGYGATYYSYLFDRAIASKLWTDVFESGGLATDRDAGEKYKNEVLRWGGGRNGWRCVAGVLGDNHPSNTNGRLSEGGEEAMREVALWGLANSSY